MDFYSWSAAAPRCTDLVDRVGDAKVYGEVKGFDESVLKIVPLDHAKVAKVLCVGSVRWVRGTRVANVDSVRWVRGCGAAGAAALSSATCPPTWSPTLNRSFVLMVSRLKNEAGNA